MTALLLVLLLAFVSATALADNQSEADTSLPASAIDEALGSSNGQSDNVELTDPQAVAALPHQDLNRSEAIDLLSSVFGVELQSPAGPYDDLHISKFLSDNAGVIAAGQQPAETGLTIGGEADEDQYNGPTLFESTIPIRVEEPSGQESAIDLGLEHTTEGLEPVNPLTEVVIPSELPEGIDLPSADVQVKLAGAPNSAPSVIEQSVAVYPNVAQNTDFAVAPTPNGFETMSQIRSAAAPQTETLDFTLPAGASLESTPDGGAEVVRDGQALVIVQAPTALDASGELVPISLAVSGASLKMAVAPLASTQYPILLDPIIDRAEGESTANFAAWTSSSNAAAFVPSNTVTCGTETNKCVDPTLKAGTAGLFAKVDGGSALAPGNQVTWSYYVPRFASDYTTYGVHPQSFIAKMTLRELLFEVGLNPPKQPTENGKFASPSPSFAAGIWDENTNTWASAGSVFTQNSGAGNLINRTTTYTIPGNEDYDAKKAIAASLVSSEAHTIDARREAYVGSASIELGDPVSPGIGSFTPPTHWLDQTAEPIAFTVSDAGLGVYGIELAETEGRGAEPTWKRWVTSQGCVGTVVKPCPHTWKNTDAGSPALKYEPSVMSQGVHKMAATAGNPLAMLGGPPPPKGEARRSAPYNFQLKIDHTAPSLSLSGTVTEQSKLGTTRPRYFLKTEASDGTNEEPQSGVASQTVTVDGKSVDTTSPGCASENCTLTRSIELKNSSYSVGKHTIVVTAKDAVGRSTTKEMTFEVQRDTTNPSVVMSGELVEGPSGWVKQQSYTLKATGEDPSGFGATKVELQIDGKAIGSPMTQTCEEGGCYLPVTFTANLAGYAGGAHTVKVIVTDGAGNVGFSERAIYVDPAGTLTAAQATATLKSVDTTAATATVAPPSAFIEPVELERGNNPGISELKSTGVEAPSEIAANPANGYTLTTPEGVQKITPTAMGSAATNVTVTGGTAGVAANTSTGVDSVVRPIFDGVMTFQDIRESAGPENYSYEVKLNPGQKLESFDKYSAEIYNEDGSPAMLIKCESAHDATGKEVPTTLSVTGNIITLTVAHKGGGFTYPVVGGPSFEVGHKIVQIYTPPPPEPVPPPLPPAPTEREIAEHGWETVSIGGTVGAPVPTAEDADEASISSGHPKWTLGFEFSQCQWSGPGGCLPFKQTIEGNFHFNGRYAWYKEAQAHPRCPGEAHTYSISLIYCNWAGANHQPYGAGRHITAQVIYNLSAYPFTWHKHLTVQMYGDGHVASYDTECVCNPSKPGDPGT